MGTHVQLDGVRKIHKNEAKSLIAATTPVITRHTLHSLHCAYLSLLRNGNVHKSAR